jgi:hypothetical protein
VRVDVARTKVAGPKRRGRKSGLRRLARRKLGTSGAVYVEFLVVFIPVFLFFLCIIQLIWLRTASLVVSHSALVGARQAAVILPDNPANWGGLGVNVNGGARKKAIEDAVKAHLAALGNEDTASIKTSLSGGRQGRIVVEVTYNYECHVPGAALIACGGASKTITAKAQMTNMDAEYIYSAP